MWTGRMGKRGDGTVSGRRKVGRGDRGREMVTEKGVLRGSVFWIF